MPSDLHTSVWSSGGLLFRPNIFQGDIATVHGLKQQGSNAIIDECYSVVLNGGDFVGNV